MKKINPDMIPIYDKYTDRLVDVLNDMAHEIRQRPDRSGGLLFMSVSIILTNAFVNTLSSLCKDDEEAYKYSLKKHIEALMFGTQHLIEEKEKERN